MHVRLADFDKHRLDKLLLTPPHLYKPWYQAAIEMKNLMELFRNDPEHKKDLDHAL